MKPFNTFLFFVAILLVAQLYSWKERLPFLSDENLEDTITVVLDASHADTSQLQFSQKVTKQDTFILAVDQSKKNLWEKADSEVVRIMWMGDSQLEGDFMTSTFRNEMQQEYGGKGIGYMPAKNYFNTTEGLAIITNDFEEETVADYNGDSLNLGLYGRRYTPIKEEAEIRIKNRSENHNYTIIRLAYSGYAELKVVQKGSENDAVLSSSERILSFDIKASNNGGETRLIFSNCRDFNLFALSFQDTVGVVVDHVPFRGNLNLRLNHFKQEGLSQMAAIYKPDMVVLQFGLNVIPDVRDSYESYGIALERDVRILQCHLPDAEIVLIGAPDMAHKVNGELVAYANIEDIIYIQKRVALKTGALFWDMRLAMGGSNSIIKLAEEGLARSDYAHLTMDGAAYMSKQFYKFIRQSEPIIVVKNDSITH